MRPETPLFSWTVFPLVLGAALAWALFQLEAGAGSALVLGPPTLACYLLILLLERIYPKHGAWLHSRGDVRVDLGYLVTSAASVQLAELAALLAGGAAAAWLAARTPSGLWPAGWPLLAQLVLALVVAELPKYWFHRLSHQVDWLWRFHATHHSIPRLYFLNAVRFHPVDIAADAVLGLGTLALLGCGPAVIALFVLVSGVHGLFQHSNLQLRLGPLNWFFSMAELHRWHHSRITREANHNYGQNLIVWDLVFGTWYLPRDREPPAEVGLDGLPAFPSTLWAQLASPFRWRRIREGTA